MTGENDDDIVYCSSHLPSNPAPLTNIHPPTFFPPVTFDYATTPSITYHGNYKMLTYTPSYGSALTTCIVKCGTTLPANLQPGGADAANCDTIIR
jgi:hypothetical protein